VDSAPTCVQLNLPPANSRLWGTFLSNKTLSPPAFNAILPFGATKVGAITKVVRASYHMQEGMSEDIKIALGVLTPEDRALVISRVIDGMDFKQLSQIYGIRDATLRKRYERAKTKLANTLRGMEGRYE